MSPSIQFQEKAMLWLFDTLEPAHKMVFFFNCLYLTHHLSPASHQGWANWRPIWISRLLPALVNHPAMTINGPVNGDLLGEIRPKTYFHTTEHFHIWIIHLTLLLKVHCLFKVSIEGIDLQIWDNVFWISCFHTVCNPEKWWECLVLSIPWLIYT